MIPQDNFIIVAKIDPIQLDKLRSLLKTMTFADRTGMADPANSLVQFVDFDEIHYARFVVLADNTLSDRAPYRDAYPQLPCCEPSYLCFMVDCDGSADDLLARMTQRPDGLRTIFGHCEEFAQTTDLHGWLRARRIKPAASYVNWVGRSVGQVREEARLHELLRVALSGIDESEPQKILVRLRQSIMLPEPLKPTPPTPVAWRIYNLSHLLLPFVIAVACLALFPIITIVLLGIGSVLFVVALRRHEQTDKFVEQRYDANWVAELRKGEDHDVSNQYTAMGSIKPGRFRLWTEIAILYGINWVARHIFTRGSLARIGTIHFAHWVFLDQGRRAFFCSNYDGGHEAYMDDFINKVGFGLNLSFSGGIGYPTTNWHLARGAWLEQDFKRFQRRHQIPTDVWYKAYPGLTAHDLARNSRIRNGFEKTAMSDDEIRRWLAEI
jgi:hypothetical protein